MDAEDGLRLATALDTMNIGLLLIDANGLVQYASPLAAQWDGGASGTLVDHALREGSPGWLSDASARALRQAVLGRVPVHMREASRQLGAQLETRLILTKNGAIVWVSEVGADATPQWEAGVPTAASAVRSSARVHDLMQPLGAINNYAELIRTHSADSVQRYAGEIIRISTAMAAKIRLGDAQHTPERVPEASSPSAIRDDK